jgi:hypothetical protein
MLTACGENPAPTPFGQAVAVFAQPVYDPEVLEYAVLDVLEKQLPIDTDADKHISTAEGLCDIKLIAQVREWVKSLPDAHIKAAYYSWLDFYERRVHEQMTPKEERPPSGQDKLSETLSQASVLSVALPQPPVAKEHCTK